MRKAVYGLSCVAAVALFAWWSAIAYADRGYWAVGGEYGALLLPLLVAVVDCALRDAERDPTLKNARGYLEEQERRRAEREGEKTDES